MDFKSCAIRSILKHRDLHESCIAHALQAKTSPPVAVGNISSFFGPGDPGDQLGRCKARCDFVLVWSASHGPMGFFSSCSFENGQCGAPPRDDTMTSLNHPARFMSTIFSKVLEQDPTMKFTPSWWKKGESHQLLFVFHTGFSNSF